MILEDLLIMARTIFGEARGEPYEGQKGVAHVILNRAKIEGSIAVACLRPKQFSCWNPGDPTRDRVITVDVDDPKFRQAIRAAIEAIEEPDFTQGSRHYHTKSVVPTWSKGKTPCVIIGAHVFYNDVA